MNFKNINFTFEDFILTLSIFTNPIFWVYCLGILAVRFGKWLGLVDLYYLMTIHKLNNGQLERFLKAEDRSIELGLMRGRPFHKRFLSKLAYKKATRILDKSNQKQK